MIENILDTETKKLLNELQKDFDISFKTKKIDYCEAFIKNNKATIYYNPSIINTSTIAHELLHLWISKFYHSISNSIYFLAISDIKIEKFLNKFLCDYIGNCCDHYKMYPKFIDMGYKPNQFLKDSLAPKTSIRDIKKLKLKFFGIYYSKSINLYIGYLISILADHVNNDYNEHHRLLKKLDADLYKIVIDFWLKWENFKIEYSNPLDNSTDDLANEFVDNLRYWVKNKKIL